MPELVEQRLCIILWRLSSVSHLSVYSRPFLTGYDPRFAITHCTGGTTGLHHNLDNSSVLFIEPFLRHLLDLLVTTSPGHTASNHHFCASTFHLRRLDQPRPRPPSTTFRRPEAGAEAGDFTHKSSACLSAARNSSVP